MNATRTIRRITDTKQQQAETYRYWQSRSIGERLNAICDATIDAYAFKGMRFDDAKGPERSITRVQRARR